LSSTEGVPHRSAADLELSQKSWSASGPFRSRSDAGRNCSLGTPNCR